MNYRRSQKIPLFSDNLHSLPPPPRLIKYIMHHFLNHAFIHKLQTEQPQKSHQNFLKFLTTRAQHIFFPFSLNSHLAQFDVTWSVKKLSNQIIHNRSCAVICYVQYKCFIWDWMDLLFFTFPSWLSFNKISCLIITSSFIFPCFMLYIFS